MTTATLRSCCWLSCCRGGQRLRPQRSRAPTAAEPPTLDVTHWTDKTELFMEYPPLVAGQTALLRRPSHDAGRLQAAERRAGRASSSRRSAAAPPTVARRAASRSRPGAFRVEGAPPAAGHAIAGRSSLDAPGSADRHDLGTITVFADEAAAIADAEKQPPEDPAAIAYLKEQQWTNDVRDGAGAGGGGAHARSACRRRSSRSPGGEAIVSAPAAGPFHGRHAAVDRRPRSRRARRSDASSRG